MGEITKVKRNQVWRDGDRRMKGRTVTIQRVLGTFAEVLSNGGYASRVRLDRFDGRQYVLVEGKDG